ncbi:MAG: signal peptidase I [Elusimicrobiaceae bacterium]|nr:signal peptidase I [Elusimicrobiaceae bacterium]
MEQRLFIIACIMYVFSWISKKMFKKNKISEGNPFGIWNSLFLVIILSCAYYVFSFIMSSGAENPLLNQGFSFKKIIISLIIIAISVYGFFSAKKKKEEDRKLLIKFNLEWANTVYFAGFVASVIMFFFVQAFKIPSASMQNTLLIGDHLFVNKAIYGFRIPLTQIRFLEFNKIKKGDIIVFTFPAETKDQINCGGYQYGRDYVKRVVALEGDKVEVKNAQLYVNDQMIENQGYEIYEPIERIYTDRFIPQDLYQTLWENRVLEHELGLSLRDNFGPVVVPQGQYFAMGDNRDNSCDSRFWGPVPRKNIKGTVWFIHWPLKRIGIVK